MAARELLCFKLENSCVQTAPPITFSSCDVFVVENLNAAHKALLAKTYAVGLVMVNSARDEDVYRLHYFLELHQSTRWVGVFSSEKIKQPLYRTLIVAHLFDFHTWPIDPIRLEHTLGHAFGYAALHDPPDSAAPGKNDMALVGQSSAIQTLRKQITKIAQAGAPVLIWGESGSGKELTAHAIHVHSPRAANAFIAVNCGAIPASLIQSELFGYERGAFTGAVKDKQGLIESAQGGTLFLDEVADLPLEMQANLLRFLQERTITRVGATRSIAVDVRVIAASHMHLQDAVKQGRFREDLLYRLNVLPLTVPPLRERKEDLEQLVQHFFKIFAHDKNPRITGLSARAMLAIRAHDWPGNVRELINRIRRAMVMAEGHRITPEDLDLPMPTELRNGEALQEVRIRAERNAIHDKLQDTGSNITRAARDLGVSRMTLYRLMEKHGISS
jgi:DNA-binding NtrC family response regulator